MEIMPRSFLAGWEHRTGFWGGGGAGVGAQEPPCLGKYVQHPGQLGALRGPTRD